MAGLSKVLEVGGYTIVLYADKSSAVAVLIGQGGFIIDTPEKAYRPVSTPIEAMALIKDCEENATDWNWIVDYLEPGRRQREGEQALWEHLKKMQEEERRRTMPFVQPGPFAQPQPFVQPFPWHVEPSKKTKWFLGDFEE